MEVTDVDCQIRLMKLLKLSLPCAMMLLPQPYIVRLGLRNGL